MRGLQPSEALRLGGGLSPGWPAHVALAGKPMLTAGRPPRPGPRPREGLHGVVWLLASPPERVIEGKVCRGPCDGLGLRSHTP